MRIASWMLVNVASICVLDRCLKGKKKSLHFCKNTGWRNLTQMLFPVCLSVALLWVLHIILQEDVWRRRPRNTVAIVSHFSFSVLIKENWNARTPSHWHVYTHVWFIPTKPDFLMKAFLQSVYILCFHFIFQSHLPHTRSVQPLTTVAMAARSCGTENVNASCNILSNIQKWQTVLQICWTF